MESVGLIILLLVSLFEFWYSSNYFYADIIDKPAMYEPLVAAITVFELALIALLAWAGWGTHWWEIILVVGVLKFSGQYRGYWREVNRISRHLSGGGMTREAATVSARTVLSIKRKK